MGRWFGFFTGGGRRTDLHAAAAPDTGAAAEHKLRGGAQPFRIVAPLTAQRAPLQKYSLPYARSVMYCKFFDVKNSSCHKYSILYSIYINVNVDDNISIVQKQINVNVNVKAECTYSKIHECDRRYREVITRLMELTYVVFEAKLKSVQDFRQI